MPNQPLKGIFIFCLYTIIIREIKYLVKLLKERTNRAIPFF